MKVHQIINSIFESNTFILTYENKCWIIDIGDTDKISDFISDKYELKGVLLTHSHFDHIYGINDFLKKFPDCKIYTSEYGETALKDAKKNLSFYHEQAIEYLEDNVQILKEGDKIELFHNIYLEVLETPGHCPSCLTYYTDNYIFTGDSYIPNLKVVTNLPKGNKIQAQESLERIKELAKNRIICPGHGKIFDENI
ncbi:MAG: MBL fold metallo-hydrolase [Bacteroidales bacterium]|nr:MBL fold metallo-hydrolase [Bacteroidales bacterium]